MRPSLYGAWHEIVNLSRFGQPLEREYNIVGPICESGDTLGYGRALPETHANDVMLLATAGAYGRTMAPITIVVSARKKFSCGLVKLALRPQHKYGGLTGLLNLQFDLRSNCH